MAESGDLTTTASIHDTKTTVPVFASPQDAALAAAAAALNDMSASNDTTPPKAPLTDGDDLSAKRSQEQKSDEPTVESKKDANADSPTESSNNNEENDDQTENNEDNEDTANTNSSNRPSNKKSKKSKKATSDVAGGDESTADDAESDNPNRSGSKKTLKKASNASRKSKSMPKRSGKDPRKRSDLTAKDRADVLAFADTINWQPRFGNRDQTKAFCQQHNFDYEGVCSMIIDTRAIRESVPPLTPLHGRRISRARSRSRSLIKGPEPRPKTKTRAKSKRRTPTKTQPNTVVSKSAEAVDGVSDGAEQPAPGTKAINVTADVRALCQQLAPVNCDGLLKRAQAVLERKRKYEEIEKCVAAAEKYYGDKEREFTETLAIVTKSLKTSHGTTATADRRSDS